MHMESTQSGDNLLSVEPNLYQFEKKCDFSQSLSKNSFRISPSEIPKDLELRKRSLSSQNEPENHQALVLEPTENYNESFSNGTEDQEYDEFDDASSVIMEEDEDEKDEQSEREEGSETQENFTKPEAFEEEVITEKMQEEEKEVIYESENESKDQFELDMIMDLVARDPSYLKMPQKMRYSDKYSHIKIIIFPDDLLRYYWDFALVMVLTYTFIIMPFRIAFLSDYDDTVEWSTIDWVTDVIFYVDILVNFFSAYYDFEDELVFSRKKIVSNYITGWFFFDLVGVFPFNRIFETNRYGNLVRVSRLPRLYKLLRLTKLLRLSKLVKERSKILRKIIDVLKISSGFERIFVSFLSVLLFCHMAACFWFMSGDLDESQDNWIVRLNFIDESPFDCYIAAFYYIVQTVVTVGYGDIYPGDTLERTFTCFLMFIGVFFYSFTIGSLSSLLSKMDSQSAQLDMKLNTLIQLKSQYNINDELYNRLKRGIKYGLSKYNFDKIEFLDNLPIGLRVELSVIMHRSLVEGIDFFKNKPTRFIAFIGPYLKPIKHGKDEYIYSEGDYADEMFFIKQGNVSLVLKEFHNFEYLTIEKGYYFGEVDLLFGETRKVTIMANNDLELLALNKKHFTKIFFNEFREIGSEIYKNALKRKFRSAVTYKEALDFCKKENLHSLLQRPSQLRKNKSSAIFQAQVSLAKDFSSSLKENEVFATSYRPFNKESFYIPRHTVEITHKIDAHFNEISALENKKVEHGLLNPLSPQQENSRSNNEENSPKEIYIKEHDEKEEKIIQKGGFKNKKESYLEKFACMMAQTPLITNNYIPFDLNLDENKKSENNLKKVDELQEKIIKMDRNMEEILNVFKDLGISLQ